MNDWEKEQYDRKIIQKGIADENRRIRSDIKRRKNKQARQAEMLIIKAELQKLKDRLRKLNYTLTDSYGTIAIFDDLDRPEDDPEGKVVGSLS